MLNRTTAVPLCTFAYVWLAIPFAVQATQPISVGKVRQLFVDDYLISKATNCQQVVHAGEKDARNPVGPYCHGGTVIADANGSYKMWYSDPMVYQKVGGVEGRLLTSEDGIHWNHTDLGGNGLSGDGSVFMPTKAAGRPEHKYWYSPSVFCDRNATKTAEKYKLAIWGFNGLCAAYSADGLNWEMQKPYPLTTKTRDVLAPCWDPVRKRYMIFCQVNVASPKYHGRAAGLAWSNDFRDWNWEGIVLRPDDTDPPGMQVHAMAGFWHESVFLGLLQMFQTQPDRTAGRIGSETEIGYMDIQVATSRDGLNWKRPSDRTPIVPMGNAKNGDFDAGYIITSQGPIDVGDEHWLYYSARSWTTVLEVGRNILAVSKSIRKHFRKSKRRFRIVEVWALLNGKGTASFP